MRTIRHYIVGANSGSDRWARVTDYGSSQWNGASISFLNYPQAAKGDSLIILRLTFSPLSDSLVRQHGERSTDGGRTWTTQYDLLYHRVR